MTGRGAGLLRCVEASGKPRFAGTTCVQTEPARGGKAVGCEGMLGNQNCATTRHANPA